MANFYGLFAGAAARFPDHTAVEVIRTGGPGGQGGGVETWTYHQLEDDAARWASWLTAQGVLPGDRCAILAPNDARWISAYFGVLRVGAVAVPLDTNYKAAQVAAVMQNSGARVLFTAPKFADLAAEAAPGAVRPDLFAPLSHRPAGTLAPPVARDASDPAVMLYTSGTTSDPKGVVLTHGNLEAERAAAFKIVTLTDRDAVLGVLPLFHALAQLANLLLPLIVGGRVVFLETVSSSALLLALQERGITVFACVPQFFYLIHQRVMTEVSKRGALGRRLFRLLLRANGRLRDMLGWNPGRWIFRRVHHALGQDMRVLVTGGSKFDPTIGRELYELGFTLQNAYGLTECTGGATICRPEDGYSTSVGRPIEGVEIRILREARANGAADYDDGEILIRGPIVMQGYYNRPDATAATLKDGWLYTGDLGYLDAKGQLYVTGRKKEIIVLASGKNLYPEEIETHYRQTPLIKEICILGLTTPGAPTSERLHAVIVPDEDVMRARGITNIRELIRFDVEGLSVQLPAHKRILSYDLWSDPLPRTSTGKVKRHEVERRVRDKAAAVAQPSAARTLSDDERRWLQDADHAAALDAVREKLGRRDIAPDANLELDLTLDSMERVELLTMLEQRAGTRVTPEQRATIFTVRQLVDAVYAAGGATGGAASTEWSSILSHAPDPAVVGNLRRGKPFVWVPVFITLRLARLCLRLLLRMRVTGLDRLPAATPFLIAPNHVSFLDAFVVLSALPYRILKQLFFVGASEYFETPLMQAIARAGNVIPVDSNANLVTAMQAGATGLREGKVLVIFPEGERSIDGQLKPFRKGTAILSAHMEAPVVPVALEGLYELWPRGRGFRWSALLPWKATPVRVTFGSPIEMAVGDDAANTAALRAAMEDLLARR